MVFPGCLKISKKSFKEYSPWKIAKEDKSGTGSKPFVDSQSLRIDLELGSITTGRFANLIQKNTNAKHGLQVIREDSTSAFVLNLGEDGSATVCRGWRYLFFNDGPQVKTTEHIREQLGYRGNWERKDAELGLNIRLDDTVCSSVSEYSHLVPHHSSEWHLLCLPFVPRNHPILTKPILACKLSNMDPALGEDEPHLIPGVLPGRWIVLGSGNGLRAKFRANSVSGEKLPILQLELSPEPIEFNAWKRSF